MPVTGVKEVLRNLDVWNGLLKAGCTAVANNIAGRMTAYAKKNAPWQPNYVPPKPMKFTGHARQGLFSGVQWEGNYLIVSISHSVNYGVYLELCNDGKFAILEQTRDMFGEEFYTNIKELVRG